ncbi:unnamed protein product [Cladocopium goreaui]|uniref:Uncharacterized protein n=1 Tax=Cladocopium goreaui TaxID=2562237 RepID=A0A9P1DBJ5_9DINO|nr:unnamed protein product [Cladocopium goreaui]|mmetsp:Transcript_6313/g.14318  ORF Transcript_6313/g.14318 Transcript_6313/m.14318 type:complete len:343 (+) Transcript_6313:32-1060(+)
MDSVTECDVKQVYQKKLLSQLNVARIEAISSSGVRHYAVLLCEDEKVFHCQSDECEGTSDTKEVIVESMDDFAQRYDQWQACQLPDSADHAKEVLQLLDRLKTRRQGDEDLPCRRCCSKHFAESCFEVKKVGEVKLTREQILFHVANLLTSLKTGVVAGMSAACVTTTMTIRTPILLLGRIPLRYTTTTAIVPYMGRLAATGVGTGVFAAGVAVGLAWNFAVNLYARRFNERLAASTLPICVCNSTDKEVTLQLRSVRGGISLADLVQSVREYCGAGCRTLALQAGVAGELNPPCEEADPEQRFLLCAFIQNKKAASLQVHRGDVLLWSGEHRGFTQVQLHG